MKTFNVIQGSEQWHAMRRGRPTASRFSDIITAAKGELSKSATAYMYELIAETFITDVPPVDFFGNKWTDRGTDLEPEARESFAAITGLDVIEAGFVTRDDQVVGCSPDAFIIDPVTMEPVAGLEIKCPAPKKHVEIVAGGELPLEYKQQVHGGMAVSGLSSWWFMSHCPGMAPVMVNVMRDDYTAKVSTALDDFLILYADMREKLIPKLKLGGRPVRRGEGAV